MPVVIETNRGSVLELGPTTPLDVAIQLSKLELNTEQATTEVKTYALATDIVAQPKRTFAIAGYQDWTAGATSVCQYLEKNQGTLVDYAYWQYGKAAGGTGTASQPKIAGRLRALAPKRGGTVDEPEEFELELPVSTYAVTPAPVLE